MLETKFSSAQFDAPYGVSQQANSHAQLLISVTQLFQRAQRHSLWYRLKARLLGKTAQLLNLSDFRGRLLSAAAGTAACKPSSSIALSGRSSAQVISIAPFIR